MGGNSGGGGGGGTTITKSDPWDQQKPFLEYGFKQAQDQFKENSPAYYGGETLVPLSRTTNQAIALQKQRALSGNPLMNTSQNALYSTAAGGMLNGNQAINQSLMAGQNALTDTASGRMLNGNPYLDANFRAGADSITRSYNDAVNSQTAGFAGAGRTGSGMQAFYQDRQNDTLAKNLGNLASQTYYDNYNNERANQLSTAQIGQQTFNDNYNAERANQLNATQLAPQYAQEDYNNINALSDAGAAEDSNNQQILNAKIDKYNYEQNLPSNKLAQYMGLVQGNYGGSSSNTSTPTYSRGSRLGGALGGAAGGAALGSFIPGVGTAIGAGVGGLLGAFGGGFSDRRLKTDITAIGKADNGLVIYKYRFIGNPIFQIGFMADEVNDVSPDCVQLDESGYFKVDYDRATQVRA